MVPLILWASHALCAQLLPGGVPIDLSDISLEAVMQSLMQYVVGAVVLAAGMAVCGRVLAWGVLAAARRTPGAEQRAS